MASTYPTEEIDSLFFQLMEHVLNINRAEVVLDANSELDQRALNDAIQFLNRLEKKEPIQYIIGQTSCLLYTSPSPRDRSLSRMPSSA